MAVRVERWLSSLHLVLPCLMVSFLLPVFPLVPPYIFCSFLARNLKKKKKKQNRIFPYLEKKLFCHLPHWRTIWVKRKNFSYVPWLWVFALLEHFHKCLYILILSGLFLVSFHFHLMTSCRVLCTPNNNFQVFIYPVYLVAYYFS